MRLVRHRRIPVTEDPLSRSAAACGLHRSATKRASVAVSRWRADPAEVHDGSGTRADRRWPWRLRPGCSCEPPGFPTCACMGLRRCTRSGDLRTGPPAASTRPAASVLPIQRVLVSGNLVRRHLARALEVGALADSWCSGIFYARDAGSFGSLSCSSYPRLRPKPLPVAPTCWFGFIHAMRSGHQRSREKNVPQGKAALKGKEIGFCDFRVEDGE